MKQFFFYKNGRKSGGRGSFNNGNRGVGERPLIKTSGGRTFYKKKGDRAVCEWEEEMLGKVRKLGVGAAVGGTSSHAPRLLWTTSQTDGEK
jgi:hypothetical protein